MWSWLRNRRAHAQEENESVDAAAEEKEFFDAWDEMGWPDYNDEGNPIHPTWDEVAGRWVYPHREMGA
jgi:hypothetical protein